MKIRKNNSLPIIEKATLFAVLLAVALGGIQFLISCKLATAGYEVGKTEKRIQELESENSLLYDSVSKMGSLSEVSSKAEELGFVRTTHVVHLIPQLPVALNQK